MRPLGWVSCAILAAVPADAAGQCVCPKLSFGSSPRAFPTGPVAADVGAIADVTGDDRLDFVLATRSFTGVVTTLAGDGDGHLGAPLVSDIGSGGKEAILTADFDEDGRLDVALGGGQGTPVATALGNGAGSFTYAWSAFVGVDPSSLAAADFDGDTHLDLAVSASSSSHVAILLGRGDGTFLSPSFVPTAFFVKDVVAADWNQDGMVDLAYVEGSNTAVRLRLGDGTGAFGPALRLDAGLGARYLKTADLDGDGHLDLLASRPNADIVSVLRGLGGATFAPRADYPALDEMGYYALGDLDSDGRVDLVASHTLLLSGHLSVMRGAAGAGFLPAVRAVLGVVGDIHLADFDRDGRLDAGTVAGLSAIVARGRGDGSFEQPTRFPMTGGPRGLAVARMNTDARPDLIVSHEGGISVRVTNGAGGLGPPFTIALPGAPRTMSPADLDGDLDVDVLLGGPAGGVLNGIRVLLNDGNGSLTLGEFHAAGENTTGAALGDLDEDGHLDAVATESVAPGPKLWLFRGGGDGTFAPAGTVPLTGAAPNSVVIADLNGDSHVDVAVGHSFVNEVEVLLGNGTGGFSSRTRYPAIGVGMAVADVNEDTVPDLVTGGSVLLGTGTGAFQPRLPLPVTTVAERVIPVDINGDGHLDIVGNHGFSTASTLMGDGTGAFVQLQEHVPVSGAFDVAVLDLDTDSRLDIIAASWYTNELAWLRNTACQPRRLHVTADVEGPAHTGEPFPQQPKLEVQDDGGNRLACVVGDVAAALVPGAGTPDALLRGDLSVPLVLGRATFTDLSLDRAGEAYRLEFNHATAGRKRSRPLDVAQPGVAIADLQVAEGNSGTVVAPFRFALSGRSGLPVSVAYATRSGTAEAGSDYQSASGVVTFAPGVTETVANVVVNGDGSPEPDEYLYLDATTPTNATLETATARGRILNDDGGSFVLSEVSHGAETVRTLPPAVVPRHLYLLLQQARSSYEAIVDGASGDLGVGAGPALRRLASDVLTIRQESSAVGAGPARRLAWEHVEASPEESEYIEVRSLGCTLACGPDDGYRLRFRETTGFIPRFNNAGGQTSLLLLQNPGSRSVSGHAWFWSPAGVLLSGAAFALPARGSWSLATASIHSLAGAAGTVTVSHDGGYGGVIGKAVSLEPGSGFSFDTPMLPRYR